LDLKFRFLLSAELVQAVTSTILCRQRKKGGECNPAGLIANTKVICGIILPAEDK